MHLMQQYLVWFQTQILTKIQPVQLKLASIEKVGNKFPMKSVILISFSPKKGDENQTQSWKLAKLESGNGRESAALQ